MVNVECFSLISVLRPDPLGHYLFPIDLVILIESAGCVQVLEPCTAIYSPILPVRVLVLVSEVKEFVSFLASQKVSLELDVGNFDLDTAKMLRSG